MLDPSLKNQFQGTIRSKKFNQNFFVGRGNFFNDEATILNESNNNTVASIKLKEEKFIPNLNSSPFFYIDHYIKNPRISIQKYNKSKILNNSLKMTKFKAETSNYKQNSIENEFDYLLQVHILKIYLYFYYKSSIPLFQKSPYLRTENDIVTLISLARQIKFFKEQPTEKMETIVNECAKCMQYQFGKRNEIIFKEGSIGNSFYIILKGTVGIYKNQNTESKSPKNSNNKQIMRDSKSKSHLLFNMSSLNLGSFEDIENNKILITNNLNPLKHKVNPLDSVENLSIITPAKEKTMNEIIEFHTGASFGEYALLEDQPRSATVICKEDTHFAVLDQKSFKKVLENIETQKILSQIEFLSSLKIFQHLSHSSMKKLFFHLTMQIFKRNSFVFKEYEKAEDFFIIKSGSFKILKQVLIKTPKFEENPNFSEFLDETTFNVIDKLKIKTANSFKKNFEICILGPGEIFGENDLVEEKVRDTTVICDSELGELYKITNQEFLKRVCYDESIKIKILNIFSEKNRIRVERLRNFMEKTKELKSTKIINNYLISGQKKSYYEPHKNDIKRKSLACLFSHEKAVNIKLKNIKGKNSSELMKFNEKNKVASKYPAYLSSKHILITEEYKKKFANFKNKQENFEEKNPLNKTTNLDLKKKYI